MTWIQDVIEKKADTPVWSREKAINCLNVPYASKMKCLRSTEDTGSTGVAVNQFMIQIWFLLVVNLVLIV